MLGLYPEVNIAQGNVLLSRSLITSKPYNSFCKDSIFDNSDSSTKKGSCLSKIGINWKITITEIVSKISSILYFLKNEKTNKNNNINNTNAVNLDWESKAVEQDMIMKIKFLNDLLR